MARTSDDHQLLCDIVEDLVRHHDISVEEVEHCTGNYQGRVWRIALEKAISLSPRTLGRLVFALPNADLYGCHGGTWLGKYESGPYLVQQIVASVMICGMRRYLGIDDGVCRYDSYYAGPTWA